MPIIKGRTTKRRIIVTVIIAVISILLIVSVGAAIYLFDYAIVRKPPLSNDSASNELNNISGVMAQSRIDGQAWMDENAAQRLTLTAEDGVELVGYYVAATEPSDKLTVLVHGHRSNATMMGNFARIYHDDGFHVFMADARGHGESDGRFVGMGWLDRRDYIGWLNLLIEKIGEDSRIVLHGVSMGGATVMMMSGEDDLPTQVKSIISDCGYSSVYEQFHYQITELFNLPTFPILNIADIQTRILAGYGFREASALEQVKKTSVPIFFIHGDIDAYNPTYMAYSLYEAAAGEKELWIVQNANHGMAYYIDPSEYANRIRAFYGRYLE